MRSQRTIELTLRDREARRLKYSLEGEQAFKMGKPASANPYGMSLLFEYHAWYAGWWDAQQAAKNKKLLGEN